ncbi:MAG: acyl-ACP--UDP-N-acetylglucosamine O-acyltransferase [Gammaproteobacteria bacterium]|nr:acyl-ACP--UDP-N-acetylglucosamine O-acyltransferase [Gammaproteobacteria bacterium]
MIHPTAQVDADARLGRGVEVGPYSIIGPGVEIGDGCVIGPHVVIRGPSRIGTENRFFQFCSIGDAPQDKKYAGEPTYLEIGDRNVFREYVTVNRGTTQDRGITRLGNDNWIMIGAHIAHDCEVGNHTIFSNNASIAGHVMVGDHAILGGFTLVHQFCKIGAHCFTAMGSVISKDVPPYVLVSGHMAAPHGLNTEGLKRRGFSPEVLRLLRQSYKLLYKSGLPVEEAIAAISSLDPGCPELNYLTDFLRQASRGIVR